ncbi:MAG: hypothetical protein GY765_33750, partial [bacterium]|nr:hypothetical protein [bacterium]
FDYSYEIFPTETDNFTKAQFSFKLLAEAEDFRGFLILLPGHNQDGTSLVDVPQWQEFARLERLALVGVFFQDEPDSYWTPKAYKYAEYGSGEALFSAIENFCDSIGKPGKSQLPFVLWGHSAGGVFSYYFTSHYPERVVCFAALRSGGYYQDPVRETNKVPSLIVAGERDESWIREAIIDLFNAKRSEGGLWCRAVEPDIGHDIGHSDKLVMPFYHAVLAQRLPGEITSAAEMKEAVEETGWAGDTRDYLIAPYMTYTNDATPACWIPDENTARAWQLFSLDLDAPFTVTSEEIGGPLDVVGSKVENRSMFLTEYVGVLTWASNPENQAKSPIGYRLYSHERGGYLFSRLVGTDTFRYLLRNIDSQGQCKFGISVVTADNKESEQVVVTF